MRTADRRPAAEGTAPEHPRRRRGPRAILRQWPLLLAMVLVWGALWQDLGLHVMLAGLVFAILVVVLFPMPDVPYTGRLHLGWALVFAGLFLADVVRSSLSVTATVLGHGRRVRSSVVSVDLRSHDDLVVTLVSHALALVPGSIVLDVDRTRSVLYLHLLDADADEDVEAYRAKALRVEAAVIRAVGSRDDVELLRRHPDSAPPEEELEGLRRSPVYPLEGLPDRDVAAGGQERRTREENR